MAERSSWKGIMRTTVLWRTTPGALSSGTNRVVWWVSSLLLLAPPPHSSRWRTPFKEISNSMSSPPLMKKLQMAWVSEG